MEKIVLNVPSEIRYISEWSDYQLPYGHCIVDKGVTGCGYTEYCLTNERDMVLCSPRKLLLENKRDQHLKDSNILYLENKIEGIEGVIEWENLVRSHSFDCRQQGLPVKFMVTYDSLHLLVKVLKEMCIDSMFTFVADEFQSIFLDAYFKASTEFDFVEILQDCDNVLYLSATPMLDKYLDRLPEFKDLPFYELNWDNSDVVEKIKLKRVNSETLIGDCGKIIDNYRNRKFRVAYNPKGEIVESKEAVFYFNSISDIIKVINKKKLMPDEVNVICANTEENVTKLKRAYHGEKPKRTDPKHLIGKIPLKGEPNKMFTFCTRAVYIGADFYSDCASTYIFADPNLQCLALDISLDLPQIAGRQRNRENPFKNNITIYYRLLTKSNIHSRKAFDELQDQRRRETDILLSEFSNMSDEGKRAYSKKLRSDIQVSQYSGDFVSVSSKDNKPVYNKFIEIANERAWEVSQEDYQDQISVTKALYNSGYDIDGAINSSTHPEEALEFINSFYGTNLFAQKMRLYCEFMDNSDDSLISKTRPFIEDDDKYWSYYTFYGTKGCSARYYNEKQLIIGMRDYARLPQKIEMIYDVFKEGETYIKKDIKLKLKEINKIIGIESSPKATDLIEFFEIKEVQVKSSGGKRENAFKLINRRNI